MNSTTNGSHCSVPVNPTALKVGKTLAYCVVFVVSLIGNPIIAFIVYKTKTMRKPINYFIVIQHGHFRLAVSHIPDSEGHNRAAFGRGLAYHWPCWSGLVQTGSFFELRFNFLSIQSLVLIAVDRFGAVVFPLRTPLISSKLCPYFILATWIVAMADLFSHLFTSELVERQGYTVCVSSLTAGSYRFMVTPVVLFYCPLVALVILYTIITVKLKTQVIPGEQSVNTEELRTRRNRHTLKMTIVIVLVFALCWLSWSIFTLLTIFGLEITECSSICIYGRIVDFMAISNCAINPCICFKFCENYRQGLKRILHCFGVFRS